MRWISSSISPMLSRSCSCSSAAFCWRSRAASSASPARFRRSCSRATAMSCWCARSRAWATSSCARARSPPMLSTRACRASPRLLSVSTAARCSSISRWRERIEVERALTEPPVMDPPECMTSPASVTRRKACRPARMMAMPASRSRAMTVRPNRFSATGRNRSSYPTSSEARPRQPSICRTCRSAGLSTRPRTELSGRKVARPMRFCRRYSIMTLASSSRAQTRFCIAPPRAISTARSISLGTRSSPATTP